MPEQTEVKGPENIPGNIPAESPETWFQRTGHCHGCGQPGAFCLCRKRCGCAAFHDVGSGLEPDAIYQFADEPAVIVDADQAELFG